MSDEALRPPVTLINLSAYNLPDLLTGHDDALSEAIRRVTVNAEDEDAARVCAFNSAL